MRILFLSTYFDPDTASTGTLMTLIAEELSKQGHDITVITSMPHYEHNRITTDYRNRLYVREKHGNIDVIRLYLYVPSEKSRILGRLMNYLSFNFLSLMCGLMLPKHDLLMVPSPPLTNGITGWLLSRLKGMPFIYNVQDIYPDVAVRLGILKNARLIRMFEVMEKFVYEKSAVVAVISPSFYRNLINKGTPENKVTVIPNFVNVNFANIPGRCNSFSAKHGLDDKFVVLFAGNIGLSQGLESVLETAFLLKEYPDICLLIVGNGATKPILENQTKEMGLNNVMFLPFQQAETVPEMYATADVGLVPLRKGLTNDSIPSKLWTIMGAGKAVVAAVDKESDTYAVIQEAGSGLCVPPEEPHAMSEAILTLYHNRSMAQSMGKRGYELVMEHYTPKHVAQQYEELFLRFTNEQRESVKQAV